MSGKNQAVTALGAIGNSVDWDKVDLQAIITAANQGILGRPLTDWLAAQIWMKSRLVAHNIFKDEETYLEGAEFFRRAKEVRGWENGDQKACEYYKDQAHWAEIPEGVDVIVFANAEFDSDGNRYVRYLYRVGARWFGNSHWLDRGFDSCCRVVSLASPLDSVAVVS